MKPNRGFSFLTFQDFQHANHELSELHIANNLKCKIIRILSIFFFYTKMYILGGMSGHLHVLSVTCVVGLKKESPGPMKILKQLRPRLLFSECVISPEDTG